MNQAAVEVFLAEHSTLEGDGEGCAYGRAAVAGLLESAGSIVAGDARMGRHAWAVRTAARLVELMRAGCAWSKDFDAFAEKLAVMKPEEDPHAAMAWGLANADGVVDCSEHSVPDWVWEMAAEKSGASSWTCMRS